MDLLLLVIICMTIIGGILKRISPVDIHIKGEFKNPAVI